MVKITLSIINKLFKFKPSEDPYGLVIRNHIVSKVMYQVKTYIQFLIGFALIIILFLKGTVELLNTFEIVSSGSKFVLVKHFLEIKTFSYIGSTLAISACLDLGYMLFTKGPDEALEPLLLAITSAAFYSLTENPKGSWVLGVYAVSILIIMYCLKLYKIWNLSEEDE